MHSSWQQGVAFFLSPGHTRSLARLSHNTLFFLQRLRKLGEQRVLEDMRADLNTTLHYPIPLLRLHSPGYHLLLIARVNPEI